MNSFGASFPKGLGARLNGGPCRQNIVHEKNISLSYGLAGSNLKCAPNIFLTGWARKTPLFIRHFDTLQYGGESAMWFRAGNGSREQGGLIEGPLSLLSGVERDRDHQGILKWKAWRRSVAHAQREEGLCSDAGRGTEFELVNGVPNGRPMEKGGSGLIVHGGRLKTGTA